MRIGAARRRRRGENMLGTTCPECGKYFRKGYREIAAQHLMEHRPRRKPVIRGRLEFGSRVTVFTFTGGMAALASSLLSV